MRKESKDRRKNRSMVDILAMCLLVAVVVSISLVLSNQRDTKNSMQQSTAERESLPLPALQGEANLFFASTESAVLFAPAIDKAWNAKQPSDPIVSSDQDKLIDFNDGNVAETPKPEAGHDNNRMFGQFFLSPDRRYVAMTAYMGPMSVIWIVDLKDRSNPSMFRLVNEGFGRFMAWYPDSNHALYLAYDIGVSDAGLWVVDISDGSHQHIEIPKLSTPQNLTAAAISPNSQTIVYATTQGMGTGSEMWKVEKGQEHRRIWADDKTVIGSISFSPDSQYVAFSNLLDSPVPFANAGLWKIETNTDKATFLTTMDGGHGQLPIWSLDSTELYFIKRDNPNDTTADYKASALVSSVRAVRVDDMTERILAASDGSRQVDLSLTPNGDLVFASNRSGVLEIWAVSTDGNLQQVTVDATPKRFPLFITPAL